MQQQVQAASNPNDDPQQMDLLRVARVGRAQGLKGEVTVQSFTDEPEYRFEPGSELYTKDGEQTFVVERSRSMKNRWILKFEGVDDRTAAEAINGTVLYGEADDAEDMLEEDVWYAKDLVGLEVRMAPDNLLGLEEDRLIGKVVDVIDGPQWLLKVRLAEPVRDADGVVVEKTALVPFVEQIVTEIDPEQQVALINPPGGLIPGLGVMDVSEEN
nr:ribosome maturation factor RimM [Bifidobacterium gallicum]